MKSIIRTLVIVAVLATGLGVMGGSAQAATSCYGASCRNQNPNTSICSTDPNLRLLAQNNVPGGVLQYFYSPRCRASWGRTVTGGHFHKVWIEERGDGRFYETTAYAPGYYVWSGGRMYMWSPMADGSVPNCAGYADLNGAFIVTRCI